MTNHTPKRIHVGSESPVGKDLGESLFGIFHYDKKKLLISELAATRLKKANQVGMREVGSRPPLPELR